MQAHEDNDVGRDFSRDARGTNIYVYLYTIKSIEDNGIYVYSLNTWTNISSSIVRAIGQESFTSLYIYDVDCTGVNPLANHSV